MYWIKLILVCMLGLILPTAVLLYLQAFNKECIKYRQKRDIEKLVNQHQQRIEKQEQQYEQEMAEIRERAEQKREQLRQEYQQKIEQYQQSQDTAPAQDIIQELSKNEITFLANKWTVELFNMISNIVHGMNIQLKEGSEDNAQGDSSIKESVQDNVSVYTQVQDNAIDEQFNVANETDNIDLSQYHTHNNEYNEPTYKKPSPIVNIGKDGTVTQRSISSFDAAPDVITPVLNKLRQEQVVYKPDNDLTDGDIDDVEERLRLERNRSYLAPTKKLTPEGRYNHYVEILANKHDQYIEFKLKLDRTVRLAKDAGLTDEVIDDLLNTGNRDKYLIVGVNKYE